jgi:tetratricopeptide (TPR) repeat protein|eukprot:COSAG01_NODE_6737_length_3522_cov_24.246567_3_plen_301_part_00
MLYVCRTVSYVWKAIKPLCGRCDQRNELVVIGQDMDHADITAALEACLMNDEEMGRYAEIFRDAKPPWVRQQRGAVDPQEQLALTETLYRRALPIEEAKSGPDSEDVAVVVYKLATVLVEKGGHTGLWVDEAVQLFRRALPIFEKAHGPEDPRTVDTTTSLARVLKEPQQLDEAEELFRRALVITEKEAGPFSTFPAYSIYVRGCLGGVALLRSLGDVSTVTRGDEDDTTPSAKKEAVQAACVADASGGHTAVEQAIAALTELPESEMQPAVNNLIKWLREYLVKWARGYEAVQSTAVQM